MSANIVIHHDPEGINQREIHQVDSGVILLDWLIEHYKTLDVPTEIYSNNRKIELTDYDGLNRPIYANEVINIFHRPQGITTLVAVLVAVVVAVVLTPDISPPPFTDNPNFPKANESPNNLLAGQTNVARPLGRIPDIYGRMRVYPDLGTQTVTEFVNHIKFVTEYLIIGRGQFDVSAIKSGETPITEISGANYTLYEFGDLIPELLNASDSNEVNGQEVGAPNQVNNFDVDADNVEFSASLKRIRSDDVDMASFSSLNPGDTFDTTGTTNNNVTFTFVSFTTSSEPQEPPFPPITYYNVTVEETPTDETTGGVNFANAAINNNIIGPFTVPGETDQIWLDLICPRGLTDRTSSPSSSVAVAFTVTLEELDQLNQVIGTEEHSITISDNTIDERFYTFKITPENPGSRYQVTVERLTSTTNDASYYDTVKWSRLSGIGVLTNFDQGDVTSVLLVTQATDQATKGQERKFNAIAHRKLRSYDTGTQSIEGKAGFILESVQISFQNGTGQFTIDSGVSPEATAFNNLENGDQFTVSETAGGLNDDTYTFVSISFADPFWTVTISETTTVFQLEGSARVVFKGDLTATAKMADALFHHLTDPLIGNKGDADIDLDGLYAIQDSLDSDATYGDTLGRFSYSFSGEKVSVKDELITIANSCRTFIIKKGDSIEFGRDEIRATRSTLFNTRNKKPGTETKTVKLQRPGDFDGVLLQWTYEDTGETFTVHFPEDESALNPKKIDAAGIRNFKQAWNRAKIEYNKVLYNRENVKFVATKDALLSLPGDRVANADGTDVKSQSGEVKSIDGTGLIIETYSPVDFDGQANASVILRNADTGAVSAETTVTPRGDSIPGFVLPGAAAFTIKVRGDDDYQRGTLYTFAPTTTARIKDYIIQKRVAQSDGYVRLELTNYASEVYDPDTETPPQDDTTTLNVNMNFLQSDEEIFEPEVSLSGATVETLDYNGTAASGTYNQTDTVIASNVFEIDNLGNWSIGIDGNGDVIDNTGSGEYRPGTSGIDTTNYEVKLDLTKQPGDGTIFDLGGISDGVWTPLTGGQGVECRHSGGGAAICACTITCEIREIGNASNTTGTMTFTIQADSTFPV